MVEVVQAIDSYLLCIVFLVAVSIYISVQLDLKQTKNKLIVITSCLVIAQLVICAVLQIAIIDTNIFPKEFISFFYAFAILNTSIIATTLALFIFKYDEKNNEHINSFLLAILLAPAIITFCILVSNSYTSNVYTIVDKNIMIKGSMFYLTNIFTVASIGITLVYLIIKKESFAKSDFTVLLYLILCTLTLIFLRINVPQINILWTVTAFNLAMMFLLLQKQIAEYDSLTRAYSRRVFDTFIENKIAKSDKQAVFSAMFIDLDGFKEINDNFGHSEGDLVLRKFVELIYIAVGKKAKVVRYGGDEFLVYFEATTKELLNSYVLNIAKEINKYNESSGKNYNIKYSLSSEIYTKKFKSFDQFLRNLDNNMYKSKKEKKERYNRKYSAS
ncbi:MAG: GGDEF domain-containing protein [Clostridia bacterium]